MNSQVTGTLYINNTAKTSPYTNATANTYVAWFNTTSNQNYTVGSKKLIAKISKATLTQTLTSLPSGSYVYNNTTPVITDTLSGTLIPGQIGLSFDLYNNSASTGSAKTSTLNTSSFTFPALSGIYGGAGDYKYSSVSGGNQNYSVTTSPVITVNITKASPYMTLTSSPPGNFTYNGTPLRFDTVISTINNQLFGGVYNNGKLVTSLVSSYTYSNATAGLYVVVFNTSGNQNYTARSLSKEKRIYKATITQILSSNPASPFHYNGSSPVITDTVSSNTILVPGQTRLAFGLNNNSVPTGSTASSSLSTNSFKFSPLTGRYAASGLYSYTANSSGNENYSVNESAPLTVNITKTAPYMMIGVKYPGLVYNGSLQNITAVINTFNSQLSATMYVNGKNTSYTKILASYLNATAGSYAVWMNTTGNRNYSSLSLAKTVVISKAVLKQNLTVLPNASYPYNKTAPRIDVQISGPNLGNQTGLTLSLYNGTHYTGLMYNLSHGRYTYNFSSLPNAYMNAGYYHFYTKLNGNRNYSSINSSVIGVNITKLYASLNIDVLNFNYTGVLRTLLFNISSIDNQIAGEIYLNGTKVGSTNTTFYYNLTKQTLYDFDFYTLGNINYVPAAKYLSVSLTQNATTITPTPQPSPPKTFPIRIEVPVKQLGGAMTTMYWFLYYYNTSFIRITTDSIPPSNYAFVPLPNNVFGITSIAFASSAYMPVPTIELRQPKSTTCGSEALNNAFIFFNTTDFLDEPSLINNVTYNFELNSSFIISHNSTPETVVMYRCNKSTLHWVQLSTTKIREINGMIEFASIARKMSLYGIRFNTSGNATPPAVKILTIVNATGLPEGYTYNATFYNKTISAIVPNYIKFYTPTYGAYHLKVYSLSNATIADGSLCTTTYTPVNMPIGFNRTLDAGSVFTINYSHSTSCIHISTEFEPRYELYAIMIALIIAIILMAVFITSLRMNRTV